MCFITFTGWTGYLLWIRLLFIDFKGINENICYFTFIFIEYLQREQKHIFRGCTINQKYGHILQGYLQEWIFIYIDYRL